MKHDMLVAHPTPEPGLWLVVTPDVGDTIRPLLPIVRLPEVDGLWHVEGVPESEGFADIRVAFADAVRRLIPLDERPEIRAAVCPACNEVIELVPDHGFVWHASVGEIAAPLPSVFATMEQHVASCPMQVDDIALGWLAAAGWTGCGDEVDRRDGPFTDTARDAALRDVYAFLDAAERDDIEAYLRDVVPMTERYGDGNAHEWLGHDIYLTQHHHGAGFWDREWLDKELGERLTAATQTLTERSIWVTDDGEVDVE